MFDTTRTPRAGDTTGPDAAHSDPATSRVRLATLAAKAAGDDAAAARAVPDSDPGPEPDPGPVGRLVERWLPAGVSTPSPQRRRKLGLLATVLAVGLVSVVVVLLVAGSPQREQPPALPVAHAAADAAADAPTAAGPAPGPSPSSAPRTDSGPLVVSVVGTVARPGLVRVEPGSRVADAIKAAGGVDDDTDLLTVNLARRVSDGEQLYVGVAVPPGAQAAGEAAASPDTDGTGAGDGAGLIDLNNADQEQLEELSGVGEVTAQSILDWRAEHGRFTAVEQLREVDGIGEKRLEQLRDQVSVG